MSGVEGLVNSWCHCNHLHEYIAHNGKIVYHCKGSDVIVRKIFGKSLLEMENPWRQLPETAPFVLAYDQQLVHDFNATAKTHHKIHVEILPEPYTGNPEASILLLNLNPGFYERNLHFLTGNEHFVKTSRANLVHEQLEYPFYLFDPNNVDSPGYYWWSRKMKPLIQVFSLKKVANGICNIEYFPYHSENFGVNISIPSQTYSFYLVQQAMKRNALIIQMRSRRVWQVANPEMNSYRHYFVLKNPQNPVISENNCPDGYAEILKLLHCLNW